MHFRIPGKVEVATLPGHRGERHSLLFGRFLFLCLFEVMCNVDGVVGYLIHLFNEILSHLAHRGSRLLPDIFLKLKELVGKDILAERLAEFPTFSNTEVYIALGFERHHSASMRKSKLIFMDRMMI